MSSAENWLSWYPILYIYGSRRNMNIIYKRLTQTMPNSMQWALIQEATYISMLGDHKSQRVRSYGLQNTVYIVRWNHTAQFTTVLLEKFCSTTMLSRILRVAVYSPQSVIYYQKYWVNVTEWKVLNCENITTTKKRYEINDKFRRNVDLIICFLVSLMVLQVARRSPIKQRLPRTKTNHN